MTRPRAGLAHGAHHVHVFYFGLFFFLALGLEFLAYASQAPLFLESLLVSLREIVGEIRYWFVIIPWINLYQTFFVGEHT